MKILVIGASGLLGSNIVAHALRRNHTVLAIVNKFPMSSQKGLTVIESDLTDSSVLDRLFLDNWPDVVVNAAAISQPDQAAANPELADQLNVRIPMRMA